MTGRLRVVFRLALPTKVWEGRETPEAYSMNRFSMIVSSTFKSSPGT